MRALFAAVLIAFLSVPVRSDTRAPSCREITGQIRAHGAEAVLAKLWTDDERLFLPVASRIASGDPCWLQVAAALKPASDAGSSEELEGAMSRALALHPERVLPYLTDAQPFPLETVCEGVQIAVDQERTVHAWLRKAERALQRAAVPSPDVERKRKRCLAVVQRELGPSHRMRRN